ncbi:hypothetical protein [Solitalea longa]|nr:hypothetical protein [Solitalea longa]
MSLPESVTVKGTEQVPILGLQRQYNDWPSDNNGTFKVKSDGYYHFDIRLTWMSRIAINGVSCNVYIMKNGKYLLAHSGTVLNFIANYATEQLFSCTLKLNAGDILSLEVLKSVDSSLIVFGNGSPGGTTFSGFKIYP